MFRNAHRVGRWNGRLALALVVLGVGGCVDDPDDPPPPTPPFCTPEKTQACAAKGNAAKCTVGMCDEDKDECTIEAIEDEKTCDDGDVCTAKDTCAAGSCKGTGDKDCDDDNPCTIDACDAGKQACTNKPDNTATCSDGKMCTVDACLDGKCESAPKKCSKDGEPCVIETCDEGSGECVKDNTTAECDDDDKCTQVDVCAKGKCVGGDPATCTDKPCNTVSCNAKTGACDYKHNDVAKCTDGDACTDDTCIAGACESTTIKCKDEDGNPCTEPTCDKASGCGEQNVDAAKKLACSDNDACTNEDVCADGKCAGTKTPEPLTKSACIVAYCDKSGGWKEKNANDGTPCDDGDQCSKNDTCGAGKCLAGVAVTCKDDNPCTDDACDAKTGACVYAANVAKCDDGDPCTLVDSCVDKACKGDKLKECLDADGSPCTVEKCIPFKDCTVTNAQTGTACSDGNKCTLNDECVAGKCEGGSAKKCEPTAELCKVAVCDPKLECINVDAKDGAACENGDLCSEGDTCKAGACNAGDNKSCDDKNVCTDDSCNKKTGECVHVANVAKCDDGEVCTINDVCANKACAGLPQTCDEKDGNTCTIPTCVSKFGCKEVVAKDGDKCSDGSQCTTDDKCDFGTCVGKGIVCDKPSEPCMVNKCDDPKEGCKLKTAADGAPCDDNNACTEGDACSSGFCKKGQAMVCDDKNPCTDDSCDSKSGCKTAFNKSKCDDGDACTVGDLCEAGACNAGVQQDCDDFQKCTIDSCNKSTGKCEFKPGPDNVSCDDGSACTTGDVCKLGECSAGKAVVCQDDANPCTSDQCDTKAGCAYPAVTGSCDDGDACTKDDACQNGKCVLNKQVVCSDDGNPCTIEGCDKVKGCIATHADGKACDDGQKCTENDLCKGGQCVSGALKKCSAEQCSNSSCDPDTGTCTDKVLVNAPCDDGNACTKDTTCGIDKKCQFGTNLVCDDKNTCTKDSCDPGKGCVFTPDVQLLCDDSNVCTEGDKCDASGKCVLTKEKDCKDANSCSADICDPVKGCSNPFVDNGTDCNDGATCTVGDKCSNGTCIGKAQLGGFNFGGVGPDSLLAVVPRPQGGVLSVGYRKASDSAPEQAWLLATDAANGVIFDKVIDFTKDFPNAGSGASFLTGAVLLKDGTVAVSGAVSNNGTDALALIVDPKDGAVLKKAIFGLPDTPDAFHAVAVDAAGKLAFAGRKKPYGDGATGECWLHLVEPNTLAAISGKTVTCNGKTAIYSGDGDDVAQAVIGLAAGGYATVGQVGRPGGSPDGFLHRFDASLKAAWVDSSGTVLSTETKSFGGPPSDGLVAVIESDKGLWSVGSIRARSHGESDGWILAVDHGGKHLWEKSLGGAKVDELNVLLPLWKDKAFLGAIAAGSYTESDGNVQGWAMRLNAKGEAVWEKKFGGIKADRVYAGALVPGGGVALVGQTSTDASGSSDAWLVRIDEWGGFDCGASEKCTSTSVASCDDGDACTTDACDPGKGCTHVAASCDDGNALTADTCKPNLGCSHDWSGAYGKPCKAGKNWVWNEEKQCAPPGMVRIDPLPVSYIGCYPPVDGACASGEMPSTPVVTSHASWQMKPYFMMKYEVTIGTWECAYSGKCGQTTCPSNGAISHGYHQMSFACHRLGMRAPTDWELARAIRGPYGYRYVWGNDEPVDACKTCAYGFINETCGLAKECVSEGPYLVTAIPQLDRSFEGVRGLSGGYAELGDSLGQWTRNFEAHLGICSAGIASTNLRAAHGVDWFKNGNLYGTMHCVLPVEASFKWKWRGLYSCGSNKNAEILAGETPFLDRCYQANLGRVTECGGGNCYYTTGGLSTCAPNVGGQVFECVFE